MKGIWFIAFSALVCFGASHVDVRLVSDHQVIKKGEPFQIALRMDMRDHWHTYWENPGSSGLPTTVEWQALDGLSTGKLQYPVPLRFVDAAGFVTYGYDSTTYLFTEAVYSGDAPTITIEAEVQWLECKEICIPGKAEVSITLDVGEPKQSSQFETLSKAARQIPAQHDSDVPFTYASKTQFKGTHWSGTIQVTPKTQAFNPEGATYFPGTNPYGELKSVSVQQDGDLLVFDLAYEAWEDTVPEDLNMWGVLVFGDQAYRINVHPDVGSVKAVTNHSGTKQGIGFILLLALVGGIILNLMPCVLPVLSLKVMSFIGEAGESHSRRVMLGFVYTLGIMCSFLIISGVIVGLKMTGEQVGIGFQFQNAPFVVFMIGLLFVMSLSFFGVFTINPPQSSGMTEWTMKSGPAGAFFNGILMTLLSTPCTAPLLGSAYGWAMTAPNWQLIVVFQFVAVGLALPYLALCAAPVLLRYLPKPGAWMEQFKIFLGFPLLLTVVWLLWVLGNLKGHPAVIGTLVFLTFLGLALWIAGTAQYSSKRWLGIFTALGITLLGATMGMRIQAPSRIDWVPYSETQLAQARKSNQLVFMDFTAEWCATCKFNEKLVIDSKSVRDAFTSNDVVTMKVDYTQYDPQITQMLASFDRAGVPLYVIYPGQNEPIVLPEVITKNMVIDAIETAATTRNQRSAL
ncbi:MAG: thioredoxin family protein [Acidobacteria bacterium]|nr:thioredoxin family protein [Acidobacteriota bacterium]